MDHPNIVKLKGVITEHDTLYCVFEYLECTLYQLMQQTRTPIPGSSEADGINTICSVLGSPTENNWSEGLKLASDV